MTTKDYVLSVLYRLIKYTKFLSGISLISMISLVLFPIFYVNSKHSDVLFGLFIAFCILWVLTYLTSLIVTAILYGRHVNKLPKVVKDPLKSVVIVSIMIPYGSTLAMYFIVKSQAAKVENNVIIVKEEKAVSSPDESL